MTLENIKIKKFFQEPTEMLRIFLALIFLSAGFFRVFYPDIAILEYRNLRLPIFLSPLMIFFEIGSGLGLLFNKFTKYIYWLLIIFLIITLSWAFIIDGSALLKAAGELFVFNLNPTDFFLHFVFLVLAIVLIMKKK